MPVRVVDGAISDVVVFPKSVRKHAPANARQAEGRRVRQVPFVPGAAARDSKHDAY